MRITRNKLLILLVLVMSLSLMLLGCNSNTGGQSASDAKETPIRIGVNNWAENVAAANMWKLILEEKGYKVELVNGEKAPIYTGVSSGDLQLGLEVWLPTTDEAYFNKYKDNLEQYGPWYEGTRLGLVVPAYVDINSIEELNANKEKFLVNGSPSIVGIDAGASLMKLTAEAIEKYNLDYKLMNGTEAAMMAALKKSYDKQEPIVVTHWNPHWAFAEYDLKYLNDPQNVYGGSENIYIMATKGFGDKYPTVTKWLNQWQMDDQSLGSLMATIKDSGDPVKGAGDWLEENRDLVDQWLQ
jgi:glycine betaine/proline transport system substrate-binding protein